MRRARGEFGIFQNMKFRYVSFDETKALVAHHPQLRDHSYLIPHALEKNPHITGDFPVLCYMLDGENIASHFSSFPDRVYYQEQEYKWAWCGNLFTNPEYRGKGVASALVKEQVNLFHTKNLAWGGVFSTPEALRIYERLKFSVLGYAPRYLMVKKISPLLIHHLQNSIAIGAAERTYGALLYLARKVLHDDKAFSRKFNLVVDKIESANSMHSLSDIKYPERYHFDDSEAMTTWKMEARKIDQLYVARSNDTRKKSFYVLARCREIKKKALLGRYKGFKLMTMMDYGRFDLDPAISDAIVSSVISLFFSSNADACEIITSDENMCRAARRRGMMRVGMGMSFAYSLPSDWDFGLHEDTRQWHLTHYRGDAFGFE
jgi:GNAT superfamily N-acetyltransferase